MSWLKRILTQEGVHEDTVPIGENPLLGLNMLLFAACKECGTVFYLEYAEECPNCGSDNFKSDSQYQRRDEE